MKALCISCGHPFYWPNSRGVKLSNQHCPNCGSPFLKSITNDQFRSLIGNLNVESLSGKQRPFFVPQSPNLPRGDSAAQARIPGGER